MAFGQHTISLPVTNSSVTATCHHATCTILTPKTDVPHFHPNPDLGLSMKLFYHPPIYRKFPLPCKESTFLLWLLKLTLPKFLLNPLSLGKLVAENSLVKRQIKSKIKAQFPSLTECTETTSC
jgi:hypothetical protein